MPLVLAEEDQTRRSKAASDPSPCSRGNECVEMVDDYSSMPIAPKCEVYLFLGPVGAFFH